MVDGKGGAGGASSPLGARTIGGGQIFRLDNPEILQQDKSHIGSTPSRSKH